MKRKWLCGLLAVVMVLGLMPAITVTAAETYTDMTVSEDFIELLKRMEGFSATPHYDYGHYSYGYGSTCPDDMVDYFTKNPLTEEQAEEILREDLKDTEKSVNNFAKKYDLKLAQHQFDALVSFTYNCGAGWTRETNGYFNQAVRSGDTSNALLYGLMLWSTAGGKYILIGRRMWEANMYINGVYERPGYPDNFRYVFLDGNGGTLRYKIAGFDSDNPAPVEYSFRSIPTGVDEEGNPFVYELAGWSTSKEGGDLITVLDASVQSGITLYAQWKEPEKTEEEPVQTTTVTVTAETANLYAQASVEGEPVATVVSGDQLEILATNTVEDVLWGQTENGWLDLSATDYNEVIAGEPEETESRWGTVTGKGVNVRTQPDTSTSDNIVTQMNTGDRVEIVNTYTETYDDDDGVRPWGQMADGNWICLDYVMFDEDLPTTLASVTILTVPAKREFVQMQDLYNPAGGVLMATYTDGTIKAMSITREMVSGFSNEKLGTITLTVSYNEVSTTYTVDIVKATVTFQNYDGTVLSSEPYAYGETVTEPDPPTKPEDENGRYRFVGWDKEVTACDGDEVYTAVFKTVHTVTFKNYDGTVLSSVEYVYGDTVVVPESPVKTDDENGSYRFIGWDKEVTVCEGDAEYTAVYKQLYDVTFKNDDGTIISTAQYVYGDTVAVPESPVKPDDENGSYRFVGWDQEVTACEGAAEYTAVYEQVYTVVFKNYDGTVLSSAQYAAGETVAVPADPTREAEGATAYRFVGWDKEVTACEGAAEYTAVYEQAYAVTFKDYDGTVISTALYGMGETVTVPADPIREADEIGEYRFVGWDKEIVICDGAAEYTAVYETVYTVTFKDYDGTVISTAQYSEGQQIVIPGDPVREADETSAYRFAGWDKEVAAVCNGSVEYTAVYANLYTVTFKDYDGTVISTAQYSAGQEIEVPADPTREADEISAYQFVSWDKKIVACEGNAVYTAVYENLYTVTFKDYDGTVISNDQYVDGEAIKVPENPSRASTETHDYSFVGWNTEVSIFCTGHAEYVAQYEECLKYALGDLDKNGEVNEDDAIYLLRYVIFPEKYPIDAQADFNADGVVDEEDAIYLLRHVIFPEKYPLSV